MERLSWWLAALLVGHLYLIGIFDLVVFYGPWNWPTISAEIRDTWLRYPMGFLVVAFVFLHFWVRK